MLEVGSNVLEENSANIGFNSPKRCVFDGFAGC
jgi:hypothetical protein